jgi:alkyl sulfatase
MPTTTTSASTRLDFRKLTARIGAEVTGAGPELELDPETVTAIRAALNEHKALVFRGVSLDDEGQQRFARNFGDLTTAHPTVPAVDGAPHVLPVDSEDGRANHWPTDDYGRGRSCR